MPVLDPILAAKKTEIDQLKTDRELAGMLVEAGEPGGYSSIKQSSSRSFYDTLNRKDGQALRIIAECKKASPSMGLINSNYQIETIARQYEKCGAAALSVLTDSDFFQGSIEHLKKAASTVSIPVLRKDFILSELQIAEAARAGASAILLIVRILDDQAIDRFLRIANSFQLDCLVEVHNEKETERAIDLGCNIIGVNHRDLDTLKMDLSLSKRMESRIKQAGALLVAESGIEKPEALQTVSEYAHAALIGTYFMKSNDIEAAWSNLFSFS